MNDWLWIALCAALATAAGFLWVRLRSVTKAIMRSHTDATSRVAATITELEQERRLVEEILESMDEGVIVLNDLFIPTLANAAARRLLGLTSSSPSHIPSDEVLSVARRAVVEGKPTQETLRLWPHQGTVRVRAIPLDDQGGVTIMFQDVTEELRTLRVRRQFVANASHELKSPVAGLQALAEAIRDAVHDDPATAERFSATLVGESDRLARLISDLLDLSRLEDPANISNTSTDLTDIAQRTAREVEPAAAAKHMGFKPNIASDVRVRGDEQQLGLMIRNLLDNAIRYTPEGGQVSLTVTRADGDAIIEVRDTGIGIPLKAQARVFERFYRVDKDRSRERGGTGLGLSIVKHVVELHGGHVSLESELGEGSTFTVHLPSLSRRQRPVHSVAS